MHDAKPHGQGTPAVVDFSPSNKRPLTTSQPSDRTPAEGDEDIVIGRARGEQQPGGGYQGHITIAAVLGDEVVGVDTGPGESKAGPLDGMQRGALDGLCNQTGQQVCLGAMEADSMTTSTGSTNMFAAARAAFGGLEIALMESSGNISEGSGCRTADGSSRLASVSMANGVGAAAASSSTGSIVCGDGTRRQTNNSEVLGVTAPDVAPGTPGCGKDAPDTAMGTGAPLTIVCHADDTNGDSETAAQAGTPYGVREALSVFGLDVGETALLKTTAGAAESHVLAAPGQREDNGEDETNEEKNKDKDKDKDKDPEAEDRGAGGGNDGGGGSAGGRGVVGPLGANSGDPSPTGDGLPGVARAGGLFLAVRQAAAGQSRSRARTGCPSRRKLISLTAESETEKGTSGPDVIFARAGDDAIEGLAGDDCIDLGSGDDRGVGGAGDDRLLGRTGEDVIEGGRGDDRLHGGRSNDVVRGGRGDDLIIAGSGRDRISCGPGRDRVIAQRSDTVARDCESGR